jgi:nitrite reductase (NADH) small subunit
MSEALEWTRVATLTEVEKDLGFCYKHGDLQIAVFNIDLSEWYAMENLCPHQQQMVLSRGLLGDTKGEPKVACPLHKHNFSLKTGEHMGGEASYKRKTFQVELRGKEVFVNLPSS